MNQNVCMTHNKKMKLWEDIAQKFCRCCKFLSKIRQKEEPKEIFLLHVSHKIENHDIIAATNQHLTTLTYLQRNFKKEFSTCCKTVNISHLVKVTAMNKHRKELCCYFTKFYHQQICLLIESYTLIL